MQVFKSFPSLPPPTSNSGFFSVLSQRLFSSRFDAFLTVFLFFSISYLVYELFMWSVLNAVWSGTLVEGVVEKCREASGACWPFIKINFFDFLYGFYPYTERWRINLTLLFFVVLLAGFFAPFLNNWVIGLLLVTVYPFVAFVLLFGGSFGLVLVESSQLSGFILTLLLSILGILIAFPLGVLLSLMRVSKLPVFRVVSIGFIEFFRGSPLVALLFMASVMLPFFLPVNLSIDLVWRALIVIIMFEAAYVAEAVRGGIQSVPVSQYEAAQSIGLGYVKTMVFVVLPQALRVAIPGLVNVFIALFKDTTLIAIVGMFELMRMVKNSMLSLAWPIDVSIEGYVFAGFVYWVFCFSMSRYSQHIEKKLKQSPKKKPL